MANKVDKSVIEEFHDTLIELITAEAVRVPKLHAILEHNIISVDIYKEEGKLTSAISFEPYAEPEAK